MQQVNTYDPSPSRMQYRRDRFLMTPLFRVVVRRVLPLGALALIAGLYFSDKDNYLQASALMTTAKTAVENRPEYQITQVDLSGASPILAAEVEAVLQGIFPVSTQNLDLHDMRDQLEALPGVGQAALRIQAGGKLRLDVKEVPPSVLWRTADGLMALDMDGQIIRPATDRRDHPDLPLIAGAGAQSAVAEAMGLIAEAAPIHAALRGLVRVGERRWDMVLAGDTVIALPETGAVDALRAVLVMAQTKDLLRRDVQYIDFRNPHRLTLRLAPAAHQTLRNLQPAVQTGISQ